MNITKIMLALSFCSLANASELVVSQSSLMAPSRLGKLQVTHAEGKFNVIRDGKRHSVNNYDVSPMLRDVVKHKALEKFLDNGYITVNEAGEDFTLNAHVRGEGGGVGGTIAGAFVGKAVVSVIGHGTIAVISGTVALVNPGVGVTVAIALESTFGHAIEIASLKGAIVGGLLGGVASGPI